MRTLQKIKLWASVGVICLSLLISIAAPVYKASAAGLCGHPPCKPYFKVFGGSVFAGGAYSDKNASGCTVNYQYSDSNGSSTYGGILGFTKINGINYLGATSQYEAYATGPVDNSQANYGFSTGGSKNTLTFANISPSQWGGYFDGSVPQSDCIPDYFDNQQSSPQQPSSCVTHVAALTFQNDANNIYGLWCMNSGQYLYDASRPNTDLHVSIMPTGGLHQSQKITIFVDGNLYIDSNITYPGYTDTTVPKLAFVVRGNIYVDSGVNQVDGLYIAQPDNPADTAKGNLWTCYKNSQPGIENTPGWAQFVASSCANKVTFNGAVIARQVDLMRVQGDVGSATPPENTLCNNPCNNPNNAYNSSNLAELFNYNPGMIFLQGGFFNQSPPTYHIDSLLSLPPVF